MARRLRHIDDVGQIKEWIEAMTAINRLLKETDIKVYRDEWKPWGQRKKRGKVLKTDTYKEKPANVVKNTHDMQLPPLQVPKKNITTSPHKLRRSFMSTIRRKTGIKDDGGKTTGDNDRVKKKIKLDPKAAVLEMLKESKDQAEPNKQEGELTSTEKKKIREKEEVRAGLRRMIRRKLKNDGKDLDWMNLDRTMGKLIGELELGDMLEENKDLMKIFWEEVIKYSNMTSIGET